MISYATSLAAFVQATPAAPPGTVSPTNEEILFMFFGGLTLIAALRVVTTRHFMRAALWLVLALIGQACCYLLLATDFIAWIQLLISIGAVVVLVIFGFMLTRAPTLNSRAEPTRAGQRWLAAVAMAGSAGLLITFTTAALGGYWINLKAARSARTGGAQAIGEAIFSSWVWPFEVLSLLLFVALVGAIAVSRLRSDEPHDGATGQAQLPQPAAPIGSVAEAPQSSDVAEAGVGEVG